MTSSATAPSLDDVFSPRGVAVVGASPTGRGFATGVLLSLKEAGFPAIYPVNPKYEEVLGLPCYPSVRAVPGPVDHVVVSIPAESALALLDDCAAKGVRSVHFFTAGFSESGQEDRAELERAMLSRARAGGFRIIGPNCTGLFVPGARLANSGTGIPLDPGPVAFLSQSGGHASNLPIYGSPRGLRFSKVVSYGNALDVDENELLEYFGRDPQTEIVTAYIEGIRDGRRFLDVLRETAARKPVILYKGGRTDAGRRAAQGHTASLTSSVAVFDALCRQAGVIQVDDLDEMVDVALALRFGPLPRGSGVAVIGAGGGPSVLASDELQSAGLDLPGFSPQTQEALLRFLPLAGSIFSNPLDTPNMATPEAIAGAVRVLADVPEVHMLLHHLGFHPIGSWGSGRFASDEFLRPAVRALRQVRETSGKPVLLALRPGVDLNQMKEFLAVQDAFVEAGFPVFHSLRGVALAMARVLRWRGHREGS